MDGHFTPIELFCPESFFFSYFLFFSAAQHIKDALVLRAVYTVVRFPLKLEAHTN